MRLRTVVPVMLGTLAVIAPCALGQANGTRAVVVIEGGGSSHPYTTPWATCSGGRPAYEQGLADAGLPVFTAPGYTNSFDSTARDTGCPPQPPLELQWNTAEYPTRAGQAVLGFLGYLNATYGYRTFDLVGYSYGGVVARATIAALRRPPAPDTLAPAFSYAQSGIAAGITVPSLTTLNSPHLGSPTYDIALDPAKFRASVLRDWGQEFAESGDGLVRYQTQGGAGAIEVLTTGPHAKPDPASWDAQQVGALDGVAVTLIAGDRCGVTCTTGDNPQRNATRRRFRTDGTVPVYSQLIQPCPTPCRTPPGSVEIPAGMVPAGTVRKTFPTIHSTYDTQRLGLPPTLSVSKNPEAIKYLVRTVVKHWHAAGEPVTP